MVSAIVMVDSTTPYLAPQINGKEAWKVHLDSVIFDYDNVDYAKEEIYAKRIDIYIDKNGRFLKGKINIMALANDVYKEPESKEAEGQIKETYHDIPEEMPKVSLYEALIKCKKVSLFAPSIFVNYVNCSSRSSLINGTRPVWIIYMRGVENTFAYPLPENYPLETDCSRKIIDAETGAVLRTNNLPCPRK